MARNKKDPGKLLSSAVMLFYFSAFLLIACKDYAWQGFALALAVPAMIWIGTNLLPRLFPSDRLLLSLTNFLCALGVLVLYSTEPEYAYNQAMYYGVGIAAMIVCVWIVRLIRSWRVPVLLLMPVSLALLTLPLLIGRETRRSELSDSSVVACRYAISGRDAGAIAVIGPTRMDYGKMVTSIEYLADTVGRMLTELLDQQG